MALSTKSIWQSRALLISISITISMLSLNTLGSPLVGLTAHEGDRIFLPCFNPTMVKARIYYWQIQGSIYPVEELPAGWQLRPTSNGLLVHYTLPFIGGNYTCFTYNEENKSELQKISTVSLFVKPKENKMTVGQTGKDDGEAGDLDHNVHLHLRVTKTDVVFIPCLPELGTSSVAAWEIDGSIYPIFELLPNHFQKYGGIIVYKVSSEVTVGHTYRCYSMRDNGTLQPRYTVNVTLSGTTPTTNTGDSDVGLFQNHNYMLNQLKFVSRETFFSPSHLNFQFRIQNLTKASDCQPGNISTTMEVQHSATTLLWNFTTTEYKPTFSIPNKKFINDAYAEVDTCNSSNVQCATLSHKIGVGKNATEGGSYLCASGNLACIPLPDDEGLRSLVAIWPKRPGSDENCVCGVYLPAPDGPKFEDCYCIRDHLTVYNVHLMADERKLCWTNLTSETNITNVFFAKDTDHPTLNFVIRIFESETIIIFEDNELPAPTIILKNDTVCINESMGADNEWSAVRPAPSTTVIISDNTSDVIKNVTIASSEFCMKLNTFPKSCAPFTINATAHTECAKSGTATAVYHSPGTNSSYCKCLEAKVNISINAIVTNASSIDVTLDTVCLSSPSKLQISNLYVKVDRLNCEQNCTSMDVPFKILCEKNLTKVTANSLMESTTYNLSITWISAPSSIHNSFAECILKKEIIVTTDWSLKKKAGVGFGISAGLVILLLAAAFLLIKSSRRYCKRSKMENIPQPRGPVIKTSNSNAANYKTINGDT